MRRPTFSLIPKSPVGCTPLTQDTLDQRCTTKAPVYDADRLSEAPPTRLFADAQRPLQRSQNWLIQALEPIAAVRARAARGVLQPSED